MRINVTKTFLPPIDEYEKYVRQIWDNGLLTNQGPLLKQFEHEVSDYLQVDNLHFVANGTVALQLALRSLDILEGEIITTPFSYVATTSSILWEKCKPVFVDIDPKTLCIDPELIERAITPLTKAIMPVHVFGNPCDVDKIEAIAKKHNLKVIYDAAHAFGVVYKGKSLLDYGDISTCSFHATKLFHTIEGGAVVAKNKSVSDKVELIKRFGHDGDDHKVLGINAKSNEFQAAMGLVNLKYIKENINKRKKITEIYDTIISENIRRPIVSDDTIQNYSYYPIILKNEAKLLTLIRKLNNNSIFPRRYFYPSLNTLPYIGDVSKCLHSEDIANRILCLPLYADLSSEDAERIADIVKSLDI